MKKVAEKFAVFKNVLIKYTEGEEQHRAMVRIAKGENTWYKRLNVDQGLEKLKLDNWEKGPWAGPRVFTASAPAMMGVGVGGSESESTQDVLAASSPTAGDASAPPPRKDKTNANARHPTVPGGRTLTRMEEATQAYMNRAFDQRYDTYAPPLTKIKHAAEKLVRQRRARERDGEQRRRWETFSGRWLTGEWTEKEDGVVRWDDPEQEQRRGVGAGLKDLVDGVRESRRSSGGGGARRASGGERRSSNGGAKASGEELVERGEGKGKAKMEEGRR